MFPAAISSAAVSSVASSFAALVSMTAAWADAPASNQADLLLLNGDLPQPGVRVMHLQSSCGQVRPIWSGLKPGRRGRCAVA